MGSEQTRREFLTRILRAAAAQQMGGMEILAGILGRKVSEGESLSEKDIAKLFLEREKLLGTAPEARPKGQEFPEDLDMFNSAWRAKLSKLLERRDSMSVEAFDALCVHEAEEYIKSRASKIDRLNAIEDALVREKKHVLTLIRRGKLEDFSRWELFPIDGEALNQMKYFLRPERDADHIIGNLIRHGVNVPNATPAAINAAEVQKLSQRYSDHFADVMRESPPSPAYASGSDEDRESIRRRVRECSQQANARMNAEKVKSSPDVHVWSSFRHGPMAAKMIVEGPEEALTALHDNLRKGYPAEHFPHLRMTMQPYTEAGKTGKRLVVDDPPYSLAIRLDTLDKGKIFR